MKETYIIIDKGGSIHAHIKTTSSAIAKTTYVDGNNALESRTFAVTSNQYNLIK